MFEPPPVSEVDVLASPDTVAAELAAPLPRGEDISALLLLDPDALSDAGRVDLLVSFERHIALLQAAQQQVLASPDGRALDWSGTKPVDYTREQVGAALKLSPVPQTGASAWPARWWSGCPPPWSCCGAGSSPTCTP
jgi:hypothetical protein